MISAAALTNLLILAATILIPIAVKLIYNNYNQKF
jgi:hypothetical protein